MNIRILAEKAINRLEAILDDGTVTAEEHIRAAGALLEYLQFVAVMTVNSEQVSRAEERQKEG